MTLTTLGGIQSVNQMDNTWCTKSMNQLVLSYFTIWSVCTCVIYICSAVWHQDNLKKKIHEEFGSQAVQSCGIQLIIANDDNGTIWAAKLKSSNHTNLPSNSGNVISDELNANKATKKKIKKN